MRDPRERMRDILEAIAAIERQLHRGRSAFEQDELLQGWFVRNLQLIGEAAHRDAPALESRMERLLQVLEERG